MVFVICHWFGYTFSNKKQDFLILLIIQNGINIWKMMQILQFKKKKIKIKKNHSFIFFYEEKLHLPKWKSLFEMFSEVSVGISQKAIK